MTKEIAVFPGQGVKEYRSETPELDLLHESVANFQKLKERFPDLKLDFLYGNSYGLYAALVAAGVISLAGAVYLAKIRADLVRQTEKRRKEEGLGRTGMLTIIGRDIGIVIGLAEKYHAKITNINGSRLHIVGGVIKTLEDLALEAGKTRLLNIEGVYHHPLRERDSRQYANIVHDVHLDNPVIPIISPTNPRVLVTADNIREELVKQMIRPVDLPKVVSIVLGEGVGKVYDCGPTDSMSKILGRISDDFDLVCVDSSNR